MPEVDYTFDGGHPFEEQSNGKWACLVCRRQFATEEKLSLHMSASDLHKENLTKLKAEGRIKDVAAAGPSQKSALGASGLDATALDNILAPANKLNDKLKEIAAQVEQQKASMKRQLGHRSAKPASSTAQRGAGGGLDAMMAFEAKLAGDAPGYVPGQYRDRAKERRERVGGDDDPLPAASIKRAREINNNIDWKCGKCQMINFARVINCNKCGAEVTPDTEYLVNHLQEKRHKAIMQMVRATNPEMAQIAETNNREITGVSGFDHLTNGGGDRPGLGAATFDRAPM